MGPQTRLEIRVAVDQALPCGTEVLVFLGNVDEILLAETPLGLALGGQRLGNDRGNPCLLTGQNLFAFEVTPGGNLGEFRGAHHRLELGSVDGHHCLCEQAHLPAQHHELPTHTTDRLTIAFAEIGDRLEVRHQSPAQPHQFHIAVSRGLQTPTGLNTIEVAVDVDLQQNRGVISRPTGRCRIDAFKTQLAQIKLIDEDIDHSNRIGLGNIVIEAFGQHDALRSVLALYETLHLCVPTYTVTSVTTYTG